MSRPPVYFDRNGVAYIKPADLWASEVFRERLQEIAALESAD